MLFGPHLPLSVLQRLKEECKVFVCKQTRDENLALKLQLLEYKQIAEENSTLKLRVQELEGVAEENATLKLKVKELCERAVQN